MDTPKFKSIKIKLDKDHTYNINDKGTLTISTMKMDKRNINVNKLNNTIDSIISTPKKRGPKEGSKRKLKTPETITEPLLTPDPTPVLITEKKKRGRKPKLDIPTLIENNETEPEPILQSTRGRKKGSKNKPKLSTT